MRAFRLLAMSLLALATVFPALAQTGGYSGHGAETVSPEILAKFAPTPLPFDLSRKIQVTMDLRAPQMGRVSPDGARLFFGWSVTGSGQIWRLDGADRFPIQMTGGEDATSLVGMSPDGKVLFVQRDHSGEENPGLYMMSADGGPLSPIQHIKGVQTFFDFVTDDGKAVYFHSNDVRPESYTVYRYDVAGGNKEPFLTDPGLWDVADHLPDGHLLLRKTTGALWSEYSEWDPAAKKLTPVLGQGEKGEYGASYGARPGQLLVLTPKFGEFRRLYRYENKKFEAVTPELRWDVSGFDIDYARARILYTVNEAGYTRLFALDARTFAPLALPSFAGADHVMHGSTTSDGRFSTLGVVTATAPRASWVYDWKLGKLTQWVVPSAPEVNTKDFAVASLEYFPARDGTKIPMLVRRPKTCGPGPCPVVVEFHGGPEGQAHPGFSRYAQMFIDAGFVFVEPNVRGSDGYGKSWLDADNGPKRLQVVTDIQDCALFIRKAWAANGKAPKIGVTGGSYGGYAALVAMTMFGGTYDAGVSEVGISNLVTFLNNTAPYRRIVRITEYGDPEKDRDALTRLSATSYIDRLQAPLLIIQGASDPRVPVGEALQMYEAASKRNVPAGLIVFADEGHGAVKRGNQVLAIGHTLQWMQKYLQGVSGATR